MLILESVLRYSLYSANNSNTRIPFGVRTDTGVVYVKELLDHEIVDSYELIVMCSDGKHNVSTTLQINVNDVNDNAPYFEREKYETIISEENDPQTLPKSLFYVKAFDLDKVMKEKSLIL